MIPRWTVLLFPVWFIGCAEGPRVTPIYRGYSSGLGDPKKAQLADVVTRSFRDLTVIKGERDGTIRVTATPDSSVIRVFQSAEPDALGFGAVGPCLPDETTYSYYVVRIYDRTCNLLGFSVAFERPVRCHGRTYDFSAFRESRIAIRFPANAAILRDAKMFEFSLWFEPLRPTGRVDLNLPPELQDWSRCADATDQAKR
jgi:hypothetical protein